MKRILVTGANGFIGKSLCKKLQEKKWYVRGAVRAGKSSKLPADVEVAQINRIDGTTDWSGVLSGIDVVVHLAARVHVLKDSSASPEAEYREVNVRGTERLARWAAESGVKRLIFMSSIKVNGEENVYPYRESDAPAPRDSYAISKLHAEQKLIEIAAASDMELVILRPPLVYGPGVKANFLALLNLVAKKWPLPLASIRNRRSLIFLENLTDAISTCCTHTDAAGKVFMVSDDDDISTPELIRRIAAAFKVPARLFPCPELLLFFLGRIAGKGPAVDRLIGSLTVDVSKIKNELQWRPPFNMRDGLRSTAAWYRP